MNEETMVFLQELERDGCSYYIFWREVEKHYLLHLINKKLKYNSSLMGPNLRGLIELHKEMMGIGPKTELITPKVNSLDGYL